MAWCSLKHGDNLTLFYVTLLLATHRDIQWVKTLFSPTNSSLI